MILHDSQWIHWFHMIADDFTLFHINSLIPQNFAWFQMISIDLNCFRFTLHFRLQPATHLFPLAIGHQAGVSGSKREQAGSKQEQAIANGSSWRACFVRICWFHNEICWNYRNHTKSFQICENHLNHIETFETHETVHILQNSSNNVKSFEIVWNAEPCNTTCTFHAFDLC